MSPRTSNAIFWQSRFYDQLISFNVSKILFKMFRKTFNQWPTKPSSSFTMKLATQLQSQKQICNYCTECKKKMENDPNHPCLSAYKLHKKKAEKYFSMKKDYVNKCKEVIRVIWHPRSLIHIYLQFCIIAKVVPSLHVCKQVVDQRHPIQCYWRALVWLVVCVQDIVMKKTLIRTQLFLLIVLNCFS